MTIKLGVLRIHVVACDFPHPSYSDAHVQRLYEYVEEACSRRKGRRDMIVIGGDFNAQVGSNAEDELKLKHIGDSWFGQQNERGQWLSHGASQ